MIRWKLIAVVLQKDTIAAQRHHCHADLREVVRTSPRHGHVQRNADMIGTSGHASDGEDHDRDAYAFEVDNSAEEIFVNQGTCASSPASPPDLIDTFVKVLKFTDITCKKQHKIPNGCTDPGCTRFHDVKAPSLSHLAYLDEASVSLKICTHLSTCGMISLERFLI